MAGTKVYFFTLKVEGILKVEGFSCKAWQVKNPAGLRRTGVSTPQWREAGKKEHMKSERGGSEEE